MIEIDDVLGRKVDLCVIKKGMIRHLIKQNDNEGSFPFDLTESIIFVKMITLPKE